MKTLKQIVDHLPVGVLIISKKGQVVLANQVISNQLGYQQGEMKLKSLMELCPFMTFMHWKSVWSEVDQSLEWTENTQFMTSQEILFPVKIKAGKLQIKKKLFSYLFIESEQTSSPYKELLEHTAEISNIASWQYDLVTNEVLVTKEIKNYFDIQYDVNGVVNAFDFISQLKDSLSNFHIQQIISQIKEAIKSQTDFIIEVPLDSGAQQKTSVIRGNVSVFNDAVIKVYGTIQDISDFSSRSEDLNMSRHTLNLAHEMIFWVNLKGRITFANKKTCSVLGYSLNELLDQEISTLFEIEFLRKAEALLQGDSSNLIEEVETFMIHRDGTSIPILITISPILFEGKKFLSVFARKLSLKKSRDSLYSLFKQTLDQSSDCILWVKKDGKVFFHNQTIIDSLNYELEEVENMELIDFIPEMSHEGFTDLWMEIAAGKEIFREMTLRTKTGDEIYFDVVASHIVAQTLDCCCFTMSDISLRKKKEADLRMALKKVNELKEKLEIENTYLIEEVSQQSKFENIITESPAYQKILKQVTMVAGTNSTVLILGETGTGKELLARAIHNLSDRDRKPLIRVNCGALPENLIASELFGHEKGSFTGAIQRKIGLFELADKGTIFLDEIGDLSLDLQTSFLRVLQEGEFNRLGSPQTIKVDVRVIAATNHDLKLRVEKGQFREDLFYRLNVFPIYNIPLRERKGDISLLVNHFIKKYNRLNGKQAYQVRKSEMERLSSYEFPGNIRELENIVERAVIISQGKKLNLAAVLPDLINKQTLGKSKFVTFEEIQKKHIITALKRTNWRITGEKGAAELLNMNGKTLASKMRKLGIKRGMK